ncbi:glycine-rich protein [Actinospongicola halichondriae]|uniref:glycine-rich protein n=1 Tax=Actinospongicola halichondriae TaxID=3236844 RepID=UPI003D3FA4F3
MNRITTMFSVGALALSATTVLAPTAAGAAPFEESFSFTGSAVEWTVPEGVTEITVEAFGAQGGTSAVAGFDDDSGIESVEAGTGGLGGVTTATIAVTPGETLSLAVGGRGGDGSASVVDGDDAAPAVILATGTPGAAGFNGGGCGAVGTAATSTQSDGADFDSALCDGTPSASDAHPEVAEIAAVAAASGGGGGATTVKRGTEVLVAAGGGGGAGAAAIRNTPDGTLQKTTATTDGGVGGGENGGDGESYSEVSPPTGGGTQTDHGYSGALDPSDDPSIAQQGEVAMNGGTRHVLVLAGGGAGGGWYPGGASMTNSSGGGGSSHPVTDTTAGVQEGDGLLNISGEATPPTPDQPDAVSPDAVEAPLPETPTAVAAVETPTFTG